MTIHDRVVSRILLVEAHVAMLIVIYAMWAGGFTWWRGLAATLAGVGWGYAREFRAMVLEASRS